MQQGPSVAPLEDMSESGLIGLGSRPSMLHRPQCSLHWRTFQTRGWGAYAAGLLCCITRKHLGNWADGFMQQALMLHHQRTVQALGW